LMSMPQTAALDPIFWLHHANIDRLWSVWLRDTQEPHRNPTERTWLDGPANGRFVMPQVNGEWTFTARDVAETTELPLDYKYDDEDAPMLESRPARRLRRLGVPTVAGERAQEESPVADKPKPEVIGSSEGSVRVEGVTDAAVRLDRPSTLGLKNNLESVASARATPSVEPARVFLKLEGIRGTSDAAVYRVYVGLPPGANPAESRDRLAGTVSLFGVSAASNQAGPTAGSGINQVLEITEIVDALHLSGDDLERLQVLFVPATEAVARANFSIGRISVFKL
jgi:tyrosinase